MPYRLTSYILSGFLWPKCLNYIPLSPPHLCLCVCRCCSVLCVGTGIKVVDGKFMEPKMPRAQMDAEYNATCEEIETAFQSLSDL